MVSAGSAAALNSGPQSAISLVQFGDASTVARHLCHLVPHMALLLLVLRPHLAMAPLHLQRV